MERWCRRITNFINGGAGASQISYAQDGTTHHLIVVKDNATSWDCYKADGIVSHEHSAAETTAMLGSLALAFPENDDNKAIITKIDDCNYTCTVGGVSYSLWDNHLGGKQNSYFTADGALHALQIHPTYDAPVLFCNGDKGHQHSAQEAAAMELMLTLCFHNDAGAQ